jgi:hypothetical protein
MKSKSALYCIIFFTWLLAGNAFGQFTIYGGISHIRSGDQLVTPKGQSHSGYVTGLNIRMLDDGLCFLFTGEYGTFNLLAAGKKDYFQTPQLTYLKGKVGLGLDLIKISKRMKIRTKFQGNLLYINTYDEKYVGATLPLRESGYSELNEAIGGLSTGLGLTYGILDLDFEYEYGFYNIYYARHNSKLNFCNLVLGVRF